MSEQRKVPKLRFPEFTDDWERRKLGDGMTEYTDRVYIEDSEIYNQVSVKNIGEICLRGQQLGANIGRKRQAKVNLDTHPNTLIFTRQTIEQGGIGFAPEETNGAIVTENMPTIDVNTEIFDKDFFMAFTKTISFRKQVILPNIDGGTAQVAIHEDDVLTSEIEVPSIDEQKKIGEYFSNIDNLITLHQRKCEVLKKLKKGLLQKMFPKDGTNIPEIRFPEFTDAWEQHKLNEITSRVQGNNGRLNLQTLTISAGNGWMKQEDRFSANIAGKEQKNYTLLKQGELAYNHGNSKLAKYGAVFELKDFDEALVPRVYHSFRVNNKTNSSFIEYLFATKILDKELGKLVSSGARMDGLLNIGYEDFVSIKITVPSFEEQQKIASYFRKVDEIITLHQRKLEVLKKLKKGLLQQMFV